MGYQILYPARLAHRLTAYQTTLAVTPDRATSGCTAPLYSTGRRVCGDALIDSAGNSHQRPSQARLLGLTGRLLLPLQHSMYMTKLPTE
jgi:hypothetical protein